MDLLQSLLVYMSLIFASSVQTAPLPSAIPENTASLPAYVEPTPEPTPVPTPVPTINITPNPAYKTLKVGDKGTSVREMQEKLQEYGYYQGEIDGAFGNQTRQAVEQFQYMHGLTVDGIAGRHTLTVLFESQEIRQPAETQTADPLPDTQLAPAITPPPDAAFYPVLTATPLPAHTPVPSAVPETEMLEQADGYAINLNGKREEVLLYKAGDQFYLPVLSVLEKAGIYVISSSTIESDEYAFALDTDLIRFTHTENQNGEPEDLQVYRNDEPQLVPNRNLFYSSGILYMPVESFVRMTDMGFSADENTSTLFLFTEME